jgi:2-polyprenyl-3-methyl-5-hydroxy-6-metoxy-1,4-benzoquinol methylase
MKGYRRDPERVELRALRRHIRLEGARVADIGCGDGRLARKIAGLARIVVGIDPNERLIAQAKRLTPRRQRAKTRYRLGTAERPGLPGRRFDVAVFAGSL